MTQDEYDTQASDPKNVALAYLRMEKDVKELILKTVQDEITQNPYGLFSTTLKSAIQFDAKNILRNALPDLRVSFRGESTY